MRYSDVITDFPKEGVPPPFMKGTATVIVLDLVSTDLSTVCVHYLKIQGNGTYQKNKIKYRASALLTNLDGQFSDAHTIDQT